MLALLVTLLAACSTSNSCVAYVDAARACAEEAGSDESAYDAETICGDWTPQMESLHGAWYQCQADAWNAADCSSADGVSAANEEAASCSPA